MPTSIEELERVHLRFIKVSDGAKLTEILSKILPNILSIFFEPDMESLQSLEHPKIKALEQIISHLMMRVQNDKTVNPPWVALIEIICSHNYTTAFKNATVKRHVWTRVMEFIYESFDRAPVAMD